MMLRQAQQDSSFLNCIYRYIIFLARCRFIAHCHTEPVEVNAGCKTQKPKNKKPSKIRGFFLC
jgi:hypothetical protein